MSLNVLTCFLSLSVWPQTALLTISQISTPLVLVYTLAKNTMRWSYFWRFGIDWPGILKQPRGSYGAARVEN